MKSMWLPLVAIFFMTYFTGWGDGPLGPLDPLLLLLCTLDLCVVKVHWCRNSDRFLTIVTFGIHIQVDRTLPGTSKRRLPAYR